MKKSFPILFVFCANLLISWILVSCNKKDPSLLKVFVRTSNNDFSEGTRVVIIGDPNSDPPTGAYVDTLISSASGYTEFNLDSYFSGAASGSHVAYFDVVAKDSLNHSAKAYVRCRQNITTVQTLYLTK